MIGAIKKAAWFAWDFLIPRFITEDVALRYAGNGLEDGWGCYEIVCSMEDVEWCETFDAIAEVDAFQWLGFGMTYRVGNLRPWGTSSWGDA